MSQLSPCPHCSRHIRVHESRCPFCETTLESSRWGAALALGVTLALAGCQTHLETPEVPIKPVTNETPATAPTTQGAVVAPSTQVTLPPERNDAPAYGLAPRPRPKYGAPPKP